MKLKFIKNTNSETSVLINDREFKTSDYIDIVKSVKNDDPIEVEYQDTYTIDEKASIDKMIKEINQIKVIAASKTKESFD